MPDHRRDLLKARCQDRARRPRHFTVRGPARTVWLRDEEHTVGPSDLTLGEHRNEDGDIVYHCADCPQEPGDWSSHMAERLLHHAVEHRYRDMLKVPESALRAIAVQALYDAGFDGGYR